MGRQPEDLLANVIKGCSGAVRLRASGGPERLVFGWPRSLTSSAVCWNECAFFADLAQEQARLTSEQPERWAHCWLIAILGWCTVAAKSG